MLGSARINLFPHGVTTVALTATAPPNVLEVIVQGLLLHPDHHEVQILPLNRSNICYAARPLVGSAANLDNYNFVIPSSGTPASTIIFAESRRLVKAIASHLDSLLPEEKRQRGLVRPYHAHLSDRGRSRTWRAYKEGRCLVLVATCAAGTVSLQGFIRDRAEKLMHLSQGCHADLTQNVIQVGLPEDMSDYLQRSGRIRSKTGMALLLYEGWAVAPEAERATWPRITTVKGSAADHARITKRSRLSKEILDYANLPTDCDGEWCRGDFIIEYNGRSEPRGE